VTCGPDRAARHQVRAVASAESVREREALEKFLDNCEKESLGHSHLTDSAVTCIAFI